MNKYFSFRLYIERFSSEIDNRCVMTIADKICEYLQCNYDRLGYLLLHPDFDNKNIGIMFQNKPNKKKQFIELKIPTLYYGKEQIPSAPVITFEMLPHNQFSLSDFSIKMRYPIYKTSPLIIEIDIIASFLYKGISLKIYSNIVRLFNLNGYKVNSSFLHYYTGQMKQMLLSGGQTGLCSFEEIRLANKASIYLRNYKDNIIDVFYMNSLSKQFISTSLINKITEVVGEENVLDEDDMFTFALPQTLSKYLSNRFYSTYHKREVKKMLQEERIII